MYRHVGIAHLCPASTSTRLLTSAGIGGRPSNEFVIANIYQNLAAELPFLDHSHKFCDFPQPIRYASRHRWRDPKRLVNAAEIVVHKVQRDSPSMILDLL